MNGQGLERAPTLNPRGYALMLDLDGTIATLEAEPSLVRPDRRRNALLHRLDGLFGGRLAIVSGRTIAEVDRIVGDSVAAVAGVHGLELRTAAGRCDVRPHAAVSQAHRALLDLASLHPGLLVEDKTLSVALHYRARPKMAAVLGVLVARIGEQTGLDLQKGSMVVELRTPGPDKGDAVRTFMNQPPFAGTHPIYLGDDLTDEPAFRAAEALGGFGVRVGAPSSTSARYRLHNVEDVIAWLEDLPAPAPLPARDPVGAHV